MSVALVLDMAATNPDRAALVSDSTRMTVGQLDTLTAGGAGVIAACGAQSVVYVGTGGVMLPALIFSSARAGVPFAPVNYRLSGDALRDLISRLPNPLVVFDSEYVEVACDAAPKAVESNDFLGQAATADPVTAVADPDDIAVVLFTSGTTSRPKAVELSHHNLTSYVTGTVEFDSAGSGDAALICVPPYHVAGVGAAMSNLYAGRTMVYQRRFDPADWVQLVNRESITTATVVPTMLDRIVAVIEECPTPMPTLRHLAYGGSKVALPLVRRALELLPNVDFVNAYGLTETSSSVAVLTPDDHRAANGASDPEVSKRLGSVGKPLPGIEVQVRGDDGVPLGHNVTGELFVRGAQVSGKYAEIGSVLDAAGWFPTKDIAYLDTDGYLFVVGRSDDTIIRGGENIAPSELEDVLVEHPHVGQVAVVGMDDAEWGQVIVAVVVPAAGIDPDPDELRAYVRGALRGSRTPDRVVFREQLPTSATGKLLRRDLIHELTQESRHHGKAL